MNKNTYDKLILGTAYYPEHWDASLWEADIIRMQEHGITVLRIGDFSWGKYEATEGNFSIGYYDDFLHLCVKHKMNVIFCTPTAAPPEWLSYKHPEILNVSADGHPYRGNRRFYNYNSPVYRQYCSRLVEKLAEHYSKWNIIEGWQVDNEVNCDLSEFYSEADHVAFREYLRNKFETLENLNASMGLTFWSREYSDWDQIRLSDGGVANASNPHMMLEQRRFFSESALSFCKMQADIIRKYLPTHKYITTNGLFQNLDYNQLMEKGYDFITYDSYPNFAYDLSRGTTPPGSLNDRKWDWNLMWARSVSPIFGIMEQQAGANGWTSRFETPMPKPGQMRLWTMQSIAHGANMVAYFRWRTSPMGCEIYWHGLNDYSNQDNRRLHELKRIASDLEKLQPISEGSYHAKVAILKDYSNIWDTGADIWHSRIDYAGEDAWFTTTQRTHTPCDFCFIRPDTTAEDLKKYDLLVYPHAAIMEHRVSNLLKEYVEQGGILIFGARTGYKDEFGRCPMRSMPGLISQWCGVTVEDYTPVGADEEIRVNWDGKSIAAPVFNEVLRAEEGAEVLARFENSYYQGAPALCRKRIGKGCVYYLGASFSIPMVEEIMTHTGVISPWRHILELPECTELAIRGGTQKYAIVMNYDGKSATITVKERAKELLSGEHILGQMELKPYEIAVFELNIT